MLNSTIVEHLAINYGFVIFFSLKIKPTNDLKYFRKTNANCELSVTGKLQQIIGYKILCLEWYTSLTQIPRVL